ncbi:MAG: NAD(P)-dependent alcohol dehydrogenase [Clostridiales bacterium]|nr:NAD(P)-dependent alcohol dehydrogenase [Clostridiales bacterium]
MNRCLVLDKTLKFTLELRDIPLPREDQVVVKIAANGICGSDAHFYRTGRLGNFVVGEPYIPGHEASGVVTALGAKVSGVSEGDRVIIEPGIPCGKCALCKLGRYNQCKNVYFLSCPPLDGTLCDYVAIDTAFVYKMPDSLSFEDGALAEPTAVAVHAINRARFKPGDTGVILGSGPIGLLTLQVFKACGGGKVLCADISDDRLALAKELGADMVLNPLKTPYSEIYDMANVVFETAGNVITTKEAFHICATAGCCVQIGWPNENIVPMDIPAFIEKEIDYVGLNRYANAFPAAIEFLASGRIDCAKMITHRFSLEETTEAFETASSPDAVKVMIIN